MTDDITDEEKDIFFMKEALKEAKKSYKKDEVPVGAVLVKEGKIIIIKKIRIILWDMQRS